jgi:hypothetical protein
MQEVLTVGSILFGIAAGGFGAVELARHPLRHSASMVAEIVILWIPDETGG